MSTVRAPDQVWLVYLRGELHRVFATRILAQNYLWCMQEESTAGDDEDIYYEAMTLEYK